MTQHTCTSCSQGFDFTESDQALLDKVSPMIAGKKFPIPTPELCPDCRMQRRLTFRNQQTLYKRTCDATGKPVVSIYSPDKSQKVYNAEEWWSDKWNAMDFGRDIDWNRSFMDQFTEIMRAVPHIAVLLSNVQNSDFTNQSYDTKDCYLSSALKNCDTVLYSQNSNGITDCTDVSYCFASELLYECTDVYDSYGCAHCYHCINCTDSFFLHDCIGCTNCFGSYGLRQQQYTFFNEKLNKEDYEAKIKEYALHTHEGMQRARQDFGAFLHNNEHRTDFQFQCENVTGNNIRNSRNCENCYDSLDLEDCRHSTWIFGCKDSMDCYGMGDSQIVYDSVGVEEVQTVAFSFGTTASQDCYYTDLCFNCEYCFGCVGLRKKQHCIFNKQYSKEEYEQLVPRLIEKMQQEGVWGAFFSTSVSAFDYNESKAQEVYPLTKEQALQKGFTWKDDIDEAPQATKVIPGDQLPSAIADIPDDILNWAITCPKTNRPYKLTKTELAFYRQCNLPVPRLHHDERLAQRMQWRSL